jgi:anhydro-N-acetylmuramic acid kinase
MMPDSPRQGVETDLFVGIMSGTSLDGIDAVLVDFGCNPPKLIASHFSPYSRSLAGKLLELHDKGSDELHRAALQGNELARLYHQSVADLLSMAAVPKEAVRAIGCHGQTVRHNPQDGYSLQIGNPALLAELSGISVVADFRGRDIAAGGQGAPLVPAFHEAVFRTPDRHRVVLNIGGIANLTDLNPCAATRGFDCGPGNMLLDAWIQHTTGQAYDKGGTWASSGQVIPALLTALMSHPFFQKAPPRSCGREEFGLHWLESLLSGSHRPEDVQATLLELTALAITEAVLRWCGKPDEVVVCGGGARNLLLMRRIGECLPASIVMPTDGIGIGADWVEAMAFAWLARQRMLGRPGNLPAVTGAQGERGLGAIYAR